MIWRRRVMHGFAGAAFVLEAAPWGSTPAAVLSGTRPRCTGMV
jgi:hypothetical protein